MNNKKCPYCGYINFVNAEMCRKCEAVLSAPGEASSDDHATTYRGGVNAYAKPYPTKYGYPILKGFALVVVVLAVLSAVSWWVFLNGHGKVNWIEYNPDGLPITVMMPNTPDRREPTVTPMHGVTVSNHQYKSTVAGQGTAIFVFSDVSGALLSKLDMPKQLEAAMQSFIEKSNATLVSKNSIEYQGMPGLEFQMKPNENNKNKDKSMRGYGKIFASANGIYFLSITAVEGSELMAGKEKFLNPQFD